MLSTFPYVKGECPDSVCTCIWSLSTAVVYSLLAYIALVVYAFRLSTSELKVRALRALVSASQSQQVLENCFSLYQKTVLSVIQDHQYQVQQ